MLRALWPSTRRGTRGRSGFACAVAYWLPITPDMHDALDPLDPRYLSVLRWHGAITGALLLLPAAGLETALYFNDLPNGFVVAIALAVAAWLTVVAPPRRFRHWGFLLTDRELHVAHGWWTRVHTIVPVGRVQHIDLTQGPIERSQGVATLVLHTAGTEHSEVTVPGLSRERAEEVRDRIRTAIETSPW